MSGCFKAEPEVAGELGERTQFLSRFPTRVGFAHLMLNSWPCDPLLETYPCWFARYDLKNLIELEHLTGAKFSPCEVEFSDYVDEERRGRLPTFFQLMPCGIFGRDDFSVSDRFELVVSGRTKRLLETFDLRECDFSQIV